MSVSVYSMEPAFERSVAGLCMTSSKFWRRVGKRIEPGMVSDPVVRTALRCCHALCEDGSAPSPLLVCQRARRFYDDGTISDEDLLALRELAEDAVENDGEIAVDSVVTELSYHLKRSIEFDAIMKGQDLWRSRQDVTEISEMLMRARSINNTDTSLGVSFGSTKVDAIRRSMVVTRAATGIGELDILLKGGSKRGAYSVITGATGSGKSSFLAQVTTHSIVTGIPTAIVTLELSEADYFVRILGNIVDIDYEDILEHDPIAATAQERIDNLDADFPLAHCSIKYMEPGASVDDIDEWISEESAETGVEPGMIIVDYGTLLSEPTAKERWASVQRVSEKLRALAVRRNAWMWVGNQTNREGMQTKIVKNYHTADSLGIPKTADLHVTINPGGDGDDETIVFHIAKNRHGPKNISTTDLYPEFAKGRIAPMEFPDGWPL